MIALRSGRAPTSIGAAIFLLAACGLAAMLAGCTASDGAPGALPQSKTTARHAARGASWMLPEAKSEDLLYVAAPGDSSQASMVWVFSYPRGKLVGELTGFYSSANLSGLCSDRNGDVFITSYWLASKFEGLIYEFAHGGMQPIQTLSESAGAYGCAVDPTTGNLAVANTFGQSGSFDHGSVAVYANAQGNPTMYYDPDIYWYQNCVYDDAGNLYVDGYNEGGPYPLAVLPRGSSTFSDITLNNESLEPATLQWKNNKLIIVGAYQKQRTHAGIDAVTLSGTNGSVKQIGTLDMAHGFSQYWIDNGVIIGARRFVHYWPYPEGGRPIRTLGVEGNPFFAGLTISAL